MTGRALRVRARLSETRTNLSEQIENCPPSPRKAPTTFSSGSLWRNRHEQLVCPWVRNPTSMDSKFAARSFKILPERAALAGSPDEASQVSKHMQEHVTRMMKYSLLGSEEEDAGCGRAAVRPTQARVTELRPPELGSPLFGFESVDTLSRRALALWNTRLRSGHSSAGICRSPPDCDSLTLESTRRLRGVPLSAPAQ